MAGTAIEINGRQHLVDADPEMPLLWVLRDLLNMTETKYGCGIGLCGACTVHLDGRPVRSCLQLAVRVREREVTTIEGLAPGEALHPVQQAFVEHGAMECGYCIPGMIMLAAGHLAEHPDPSPEQVRRVLASNLCRCTGYQKMVAAVLDASAR